MKDLTKDVFISYKKTDNDEDHFINELESVLKNHDIDLWIDKKEILYPGTELSEDIKKGIEQAKCVLVINSEHLEESDFCKKEIAYAKEKGRNILLYNKKNVDYKNYKAIGLPKYETEKKRIISDKYSDTETIRINIQRAIEVIPTDGVYNKLANAEKIYNKKHIKTVLTNEKFIWPIPSDKREQLEKIGFSSHQVAKNAIYTQLKHIIENNFKKVLEGKKVDEYLNDIANETADDFIKDINEDKTRFNGPMLGVSHIVDQRSEGNEEHLLYISLYESDYFTFKMMTKLYQKLKEINKDFFQIKDVTQIKDIAPFLCSIGIGGFLYLKNTKKLLWVKRAQTCTTDSFYHFSYDETLSLVKDKNAIGEIDVYNCLYRGIYEELGLEKNDLTDEGGFIEIGIILNERIEIELLSYVATDLTVDEVKKRIKNAPDAQLEIGNMNCWDFKEAKAKLIEKENTPEAVRLLSVLNDRDTKKELLTQHIYPDEVSVDLTAKIGKNVIIEEYTKVGKHASIGDNCKIHRNIFIDDNVMIGNNVKIQDNVMIPHGVRLEDGVFVGPSVAFTNDKYPRAITPDGCLKTSNDWKVSETIVKKGASIGANATIVCGVTIGEWAMVGAGAVVTKDVGDYELVVGNPARCIGRVDETGKRINVNI